MTDRGSEWAKWDLHVHTPASIVHNYSGEDPWGVFLDDLEQLPKHVKVIGINDYLFLDGYRRVQAERAAGRLENIDLVIPVIELRIPQFGGTASRWSRVNLHVLFDPELTADQIERYFLAGLTRRYVLSPEAQVQGIEWHEFPERNSLEVLGEKIIESVSAEERVKYGPPLLEGFNNLNIPLADVKEVLSHTALRGKSMLAVGKTEWADVKWGESSIAEKKTAINEVDFVFISSETPGDAQKARAALASAKVNSRLLDCSDAHWVSSASDKDRIGNCFTWIKAERSFRGLRYAMLEYPNRVFIGDQPAVLGRVRHAPGKFIDKLVVKKKPGSSPERNWFDCEVDLNPEMVCLIGHKGSGKSAFADVLGLAGNSRNEAHFSFLRAERFRKRPNPSKHYEASMTWRDGLSSSFALSDLVSSDGAELVRYLPQSYLEGICNEVSDGTEGSLERELKRIIFDCTPEPDRDGSANLDALIDSISSGFQYSSEIIRSEIHRVNEELVRWERLALPSYKSRIASVKARQMGILEAHKLAVPEKVTNPSDDSEVSQKAEAEYLRLAEAVEQLRDIDQKIKVAAERAGDRRRALTAVKRLRMKIVEAKSLLEGFRRELALDVEKFDLKLQVEKTLSFDISTESIDSEASRINAELQSIERDLDANREDSLTKKSLDLRAELETIQIQLSEPQRRYAQYQSNLAQWTAREAEIIGSETAEDSLAWAEKEEGRISQSAEEITRLEHERATLVERLSTTMNELVAALAELYEPAKAALKAAAGSDLPIEFRVTLQPEQFKERFLDSIHMGVRSSFQGQDHADAKVRDLVAETNFGDADSISSFVTRILSSLRRLEREGATEVIDVAAVIKGGNSVVDVYDYVATLEYLRPAFELLFEEKSIAVLSPGQRGMVLLLFYLLVDPENIPLIVDQPEENLDNHTVVSYLTEAFRRARARRQLVVVTHNANLAVVCDADQVIHCTRGPQEEFLYTSSPLERLESIDPLVEVLEGARGAFEQRGQKYAR